MVTVIHSYSGGTLNFGFTSIDKGSFDLLKLDPEATHFDLEVDSTFVRESHVFIPAGQIASAVPMCKNSRVSPITLPKDQINVSGALRAQNS
jgi:hypothetical protein